MSTPKGQATKAKMTAAEMLRLYIGRKSPGSIARKCGMMPAEVMGKMGEEAMKILRRKAKKIRDKKNGKRKERESKREAERRSEGQKDRRAAVFLAGSTGWRNAETECGVQYSGEIISIFIRSPVEQVLTVNVEKDGRYAFHIFKGDNYRELIIVGAARLEFDKPQGVTFQARPLEDA